MGFYLNSEKLKVNIGGVSYKFVIGGGYGVDNTLVSSDGYTLQDSTGVYLIVEGE